MFEAVCYQSSLTLELSRKLEVQQKRSLAVILGQEYRSYSHALNLTNLPRLDNKPNSLNHYAELPYIIGGLSQV